LRNVKKTKKERLLQKTNFNKNIEQLYTDVKSVPSYSSKIVQFLRNYEPSSVFRKVRYNFPRRKVKSFYPYEVVMSDTINYVSLARQNKNFKYILVAVDVFSKKAYAYPMKTLKDFESSRVIEQLFKDLKELPRFFVTDRGIEFYNNKVKKVIDSYGVKHYSLTGIHKACNAERIIKTLKSRIERYFYLNKTNEWLSIIDQLIENYNNTYNRAIKMAPNDVNDDNRHIVFKTLYPKKESLDPPRLNIGDRVRLLQSKNIFPKGYKRAWTEELYKITNTFTTEGIDYYQVSDLNDNIIPRKRYFWELNLVTSANDN